MELILSGTIRDFKDSHVDFEYKIYPEKGIVEPILGPNRKPVYKGGEGKTTHNKEAFDQWYQDAEGVNLSKRLNIILQDIDGDGVFTYFNDEFFPIDDELFGNEGRRHNYHFTYEIHSEFTYKGTEVFTFVGDDDLWVFIDGKQVIDLGGVHGAQTGTIDLQVPDGNSTFKADLPTGASLSLEVGQTYSFDLFFAERHTNRSQFRIDTSIALVCLPVVTLEASDPKARELPADPGEFTLRLDKSPEQDLAITVSISGTATEGKDYQPVGTTVTVPAGQTAVKVPIKPIPDKKIEGAETVVMELRAGEGYDLGDPVEATVVIGDYKLPVVTIKVRDPKATEPIAKDCPPDSAVFVVCLDKPPLCDVKVPFQVGGTATEGKDYKPLKRTVVIPEGKTKAPIVVVPLPDKKIYEADETVIITLKEGKGYRSGSAVKAQAVICEAAKPVIKPKWIWLLLFFLAILGCLFVFKVIYS